MKRFVFTTWPLLSATKKDVLPAHHRNNVIYQFMCHCNSWYVERHPKVCKNALSNTFPCRSGTIILLKTVLIFPVPARKPASLKLLPSFLLLDSILWKISHAPANTVTPNSLFLLEDVLLFTCPLLKLFLLNLFNLIYVDTMNFFTV